MVDFFPSSQREKSFLGSCRPSHPEVPSRDRHLCIHRSLIGFFTHSLCFLRTKCGMPGCVASDAAAFATSDTRSPAQVLVSPGGPEPPAQKVCVVADLCTRQSSCCYVEEPHRRCNASDVMSNARSATSAREKSRSAFEIS